MAFRNNEQKLCCAFQMWCSVSSATTAPTYLKFKQCGRIKNGSGYEKKKTLHTGAIMICITIICWRFLPFLPSVLMRWMITVAGLNCFCESGRYDPLSGCGEEEWVGGLSCSGKHWVGSSIYPAYVPCGRGFHTIRDCTLLSLHVPQEIIAKPSKGWSNWIQKRPFIIIDWFSHF